MLITSNPLIHELKDTPNTASSASQLDLHLEIKSEGKFRTKFYKEMILIFSL